MRNYPAFKELSVRVYISDISFCFVFQMLLDQTDFLVVGVLGLQGSGKSTIMSLLAGNTDEDGSRYNI